MSCNFRIGHGYDVHRVGDGLELVLGGEKIPCGFGLIAHSDGDVLIHAVIDALFGAAGLPDIGAHFPDTDGAYRGISSVVLLEKCADILKEHGFSIVNVDATVICQKPKLKDHIPSMRENIARACSVGADLVNVKATTEERLGFTGSGEGIAAHCVCLIERE